MAEDTIVHGETYGISVSIQDVDGDPLTLDGTWSAACRVTRNKVGSASIVEPVMVIADNAATTELDTGDEPWMPGVYYYDIRLTDPDGHDYWTEPVKLTLSDRNAPAS